MSSYGYPLNDIDILINLCGKVWILSKINRTSDFPITWKEKPRRQMQQDFSSALCLPEHLAVTSSQSPSHLHRLDMWWGPACSQGKVEEMWHSWRWNRTVTNPLAKGEEGGMVGLRAGIGRVVTPQICLLGSSPLRTRQGLEGDTTACT